MGLIGRIVQSVIENNLRQIQTEIYQGYIKKSWQINPPGMDSVPIADDQGVVILIEQTQGKSISIGVYPDTQAEAGEVRFYSRNSAGVEQSFLWLKADGTIDINGSADYAVAFDDLKSGFDQLKSDHNAFLLHVHGVAGTPPVPPAVPSTASIDASKVATVKLPK